MVPIGLVGVGQREPGDRLVERIGVAAVARDHRRIAALGVGQRQPPAAQPAILDEAVDAGLVVLAELHAAFHVGKLAHVEMPAIDLAPSQEDVRRSLSELLAHHHASALIREVELGRDVGR